MLDVDVDRRLGDFRIQASFAVDEGLTALFGRSGAGKTSIVNMIAGLLKPDRGRIVIADRVLFDSDRRLDLPPHRRRVGYVFQDGRLFPHLTVRRNLAYGRWFAPRRAAYVEFDRIVELLDLGRLLDRRPATLSGGEKQRVAIGRALLPSPRILLMDEPLAALDEGRKQELLPFIERLRDEIRIPIVYVSHSIAEVARLATAVVLVSDGRIEGIGSTADIMSRSDLFPLTGRFEAGALVECTVAGHDAATGLTRLTSPAGELVVPYVRSETGTRLRVRVRARDVMIATERPAGISALNVVPARITGIRTDPPFAEVRLDAGGAVLLSRITSFSVDSLGLVPGREVWAIIKTTAFDHRSLGLAKS